MNNNWNIEMKFDAGDSPNQTILPQILSPLQSPSIHPLVPREMPRVFDFFLPPLLLLITWSAVTYDWPYRAQNLRSRLPGWFVTTHLPWVKKFYFLSWFLVSYQNYFNIKFFLFIKSSIRSLSMPSFCMQSGPC